MNKREEILQAIINFIQEHGYSPTVREIGEMVGLKSTSSVHAHLQRMFIEGVIETDVPEYKFIKAGDVNT